MKKQLILGVGLALASGAALAQSSPVLDRPSTPPTATDPTDIKKPTEPGIDPVVPGNPASKGSLQVTFEAIDRDADGRVSRAEAKANGDVTKSFLKLDRNADGYLNADEFRVLTAATTRAPGATDGDTQFADLDVNKDSKLSREEVKSDTTLTARFRRLDTNNDGSMSKEEFTASIDSNKNPPASVERKSENSPVPADPTKSNTNKNPLETKKN